MDLKTLQLRVTDLICGNRVVFHHVPKCGGTSVYRALRLSYPTSYHIIDIASIYNAIEALNPTATPDEIVHKTIRFREHQLLMLLHADCRCIAGHVRFSNVAYDKFSPKYTFVTTLRDPVDFFVSMFLFNVSGDQQRWKIDQDVQAFLDTPRAASFGATFASFFSGLPSEVDPASPESIEAAKENLRKFAVVGMTDDMPGFERRLRSLLGVRLRIGHQNKARVERSERVELVDPTVVRKIEQLSAANMEIYEFARGLAKA